MPPETELLARIQAIEKRLLRTQLVTALVLVLAFVVAIWRPRARGPIEATQFILTDGHGTILATLGHENSNTCLKLGVKTPSHAFLCTGDEYGSDLFLSNFDGADRAFISAGSRTSEPGGTIAPGLVISQADGQNLIAASLAKEAKLIVGHAAEEDSLIVNTEGQRRSLQVTGHHGQPLWKAP